jgi:hypothetical protein
MQFKVQEFKVQGSELTRASFTRALNVEPGTLNRAARGMKEGGLSLRFPANRFDIVAVRI